MSQLLLKLTKYFSEHLKFWRAAMLWIWSAQPGVRTQGLVRYSPAACEPIYFHVPPLLRCAGGERLCGFMSSGITWDVFTMAVCDLITDPSCPAGLVAAGNSDCVSPCLAFHRTRVCNPVHPWSTRPARRLKAVFTRPLLGAAHPPPNPPSHAPSPLALARQTSPHRLSLSYNFRQNHLG